MRREYIVGSIVLLVFVGAVALVWNHAIRRSHEEVTIATGPNGGTYHRLTEEFNQALKQSPEHKLGINPIPTSGSRENLRLIREDSAQFGIVQSSLPESKSLRIVAPLYREYLHVLVLRESSITDLSQLDGRNLSLGPAESGTRAVATRLLNHYGISPGENGDDHAPPLDASGFLYNGSIDALFLVSALHSPIVEDLMGSGRVRLLGTGDHSEGFATRFPYLSADTIPAHTYPCEHPSIPALPASPVHTLSIPAILVADRSLDNHLVQRVTTALFQNRGALAANIPEAYQISEPKNTANLPYPVHRGAERYYRRSEPGFLVVYAEVIALLISLGVTAIAIISALRRWSTHRKKQRIDYYYTRVARVVKRLHGVKITPEFLENEEERLATLRRKAYEELVDERLKADESFRIFQVQMNHCLNEVRLLKKKLAKQQAQE